MARTPGRGHVTSDWNLSTNPGSQNGSGVSGNTEKQAFYLCALLDLGLHKNGAVLLFIGVSSETSPELGKSLFSLKVC